MIKLDVNTEESASNEDHTDTTVQKFSCVLEHGAGDDKAPVEVDRALVQSMKPHQIEGVKFAYNTIIGSVAHVRRGGIGSGAILAHCMGLGKTFTSICFLHTILTNEILSSHIRKVIVLCPCNVELNWAKEIREWIDGNDRVEGEIETHEFRHAKTTGDRMEMLRSWHEKGGVLIMSYSMFRIMTQMQSKLKVLRQRILLNPGADLVICDEGHIIKNSRTQLSKLLNSIKTRRRLILTGTPLQNNMIEYYCMMNFVRPDSLGTRAEFNERFVKPITLGQEADADKSVVRKMKARVHVLNKALSETVHRCDYSHLAPHLPNKIEYVISIHLSKLQTKLYRRYLQGIGSRRVTIRGDSQGSFLQDYHVLKMVWSHPYLLLESEKRRKKAIEADRGPDDASGTDSESEIDATEDSRSEDYRRVVRAYERRSKRKRNRIAESSEYRSEDDSSWWRPHVVGKVENLLKLDLSSKFQVAMNILRGCQLVRDKVILFSTSLLSLDVFERYLELERYSRMGGAPKHAVSRRWERDVDYFRIDGNTSVAARERYIDQLNDSDNERARLLLVSTKAGGIGTNMTGANRIIVVDVSWNPSDDIQAIFRTYRFGQKKPVYVYRLIAHATMEEKIYHRQVDKLALASSVVDKKHLERHFKKSDLKAMYEFKPEKKDKRTLALPKDRVLAETLMNCRGAIQAYHEHDSFLRKDVEVELTDAERKQAWLEYERERQSETFLTNPNVRSTIGSDCQTFRVAVA
ncbi:transcriptional regulator ATRX homolog [Galendromus occidentalis]|uniref:Transcriptional regulator ATRX homolog n=1 Tax=Galendromus occidentalis TaxID=34638 RepID=A0AAJ7SFW9_9ACAR|nr:transcriptional regulator ATRX homolog [Galendromus occidentalis]